jgi:putative transposase
MIRELQLIPDHETRAGRYHVTSRIIWKKFILNDLEQEYLHKTIRNYEVFCGVWVLTYCLMSNHFHILVEIPPKQDAEAFLDAPDSEFLKRLSAIHSDDFIAELEVRFQKARQDGKLGDEQGLTNDEGIRAGELAERYILSIKRCYTRRMFDLSECMKAVKQRFTQWYNKENGTKGTL